MREIRTTVGEAMAFGVDHTEYCFSVHTRPIVDSYFILERKRTRWILCSSNKELVDEESNKLPRPG